MYNKIQPEQIEIHTFSSPSGDIYFQQGANYVYGNLSRRLTGNFNITGGLVLNGSAVYTTDSSNIFGAVRNVILGGQNNRIIGTGNAIINSINSNVSGFQNLDLNCDGSIFEKGSRFCTVLAGKNSIINENISGSVIISDITNDTIIADTSNKLYINFENGIDIAGNVVVNDDLLINDNARLYLDQNSSGIFSGDVGFFGDLDLNSSLTIKNDNNLFIQTGASGIFSGNLNMAGTLDLNSNLIIKNGRQFSTHSNSTTNFSGVVNTLGSLNSASLNIGNDRIIFDNQGININSGLALNMTGGALSINGGYLSLQEDSVTDFYGPVNFWGEVNGLDLGGGGGGGTGIIDYTDVVTLIGNQTINGKKSFANETIFLDKLFIKNGDAFNGTNDLPVNSEDDGAKGQIEFLDNNLFLYNNGRWVKFIGNNGAWEGFSNSNIGSLQKREIDFVGGVTDNNIISWDNGVLSSTLEGDNQITSFPEFGANGSLFIPNEFGVLQVLEWQNGLITSPGSFQAALSGNITGFGNGKSGLFKLNNQSIISWNNGLVTNTGTFETSLIIGDVIYTSGSQNISGSKTFLSGAVFQRTQNQLTFRTGDAGSLINISAPLISGSRIYTIPDVNGDGSFVMTTGDQAIGGIKTFTTRPFVNGTGVLLSGEGGSSISNAVIVTGSQDISGSKTFLSGAIFQATGNQLTFRTGDAGNKIDISAPLISGNRVYGIPDVSVDANFVMTQGDQSISGIKNFLSPTIFQATGIFQSTGNQLSFRTGQSGSAINISAPLISGNRVYTIPDIGGNASFVMTSGDQLISGSKIFNQQLQIINSNLTGLIFKSNISSNSISVNFENPIAANRVYRIPDVSGNADFVMTNGDQIISGQKTFDKIPKINVSGQFLIVPTGVFYSEQSFSFVDEYGALQTKIFLCR